VITLFAHWNDLFFENVFKVVTTEKSSDNSLHNIDFNMSHIIRLK